MKKTAKNIGVWIIICAIGLAVYAFYDRSSKKTEEIPYSELMYSIKTEQVKEIVISENKAKIIRKNNETGVESECVAEIPGSEQFHKDIGEKLLEFAVEKHGAAWLWALEKNTRAIRFYERHGFRKTDIKKTEDDTTEYLVRMER